jgi:hypothetical protein
MTEEQLKEYRHLVDCINKVFIDNNATLHGAINALSYMSVDLAAKHKMDEKTYIKDIKIMFKEQKAKHEQRTDAN